MLKCNTFLHAATQAQLTMAENSSVLERLSRSRLVCYTLGMTLPLLPVIDLMSDITTASLYATRSSVWWPCLVAFIIICFSSRFSVVFAIYHPAPTWRNVLLLYTPFCSLATGDILRSDTLSRKHHATAVSIANSSQERDATADLALERHYEYILPGRAKMQEALDVSVCCLKALYLITLYESLMLISKIDFKVDVPTHASLMECLC
jgi:hypothetical protein